MENGTITDTVNLVAARYVDNKTKAQPSPNREWIKVFRTRSSSIITILIPSVVFSKVSAVGIVLIIQMAAGCTKYRSYVYDSVGNMEKTAPLKHLNFPSSASSKQYTKHYTYQLPKEVCLKKDSAKIIEYLKRTYIHVHSHPKVFENSVRSLSLLCKQ